MTRIEHLLRSLYNSAHRNLAHHDIHLHLRQQIHIDLCAPVILGSAFLHSAAKHVCDGHSGYAYLLHGLLESFETALLDHYRNLAQLYAVRCGNSVLRGANNLNGHRTFNGNGFVRNDCCLAGGRCVKWHEVRIAADKTVFLYIKTCNFLLRRDTKTDGLFDYEKDCCHCHSDPSRNREHAERLHAEELEAAAVEQSRPVSEDIVGGII